MKTPKELWSQFNQMPLGKQSLIAVGTVALIIAVMSNYKNIKNGSKGFITKVTEDENVKEFLSDVDNVIKSFVNMTHKFFKGDNNESKSE